MGKTIPPIYSMLNTVNITNGTITINKTKVIGNNNDVTGDNNIITGNNNDIYGDNNIIIGNNNDAHGVGNKLTGNNNDNHPPKPRITYEPGLFKFSPPDMGDGYYRRIMGGYKNEKRRKKFKTCPTNCIHLTENNIPHTTKIQLVCKKNGFISEIDCKLKKFNQNCGYEEKPKRRWGVEKFNLSDEEYEELEKYMFKFNSTDYV